MRPFLRTLTVLTAASVAGLALACSDTNPGAGIDGPNAARVTILLTDAPASIFKSVEVEIGAIQILEGDEQPPITLTEDAGTFDLLDLQNGVTAQLASLTIEPGVYRQLRLIVESAEVTLVDTLFFRDGEQTKTLKIPSGAQTGIKVNLGWGMDGDGPAGVEIVQGETVIVVDFDVSQNFRLQGSLNGRGGFHGVIFTPLLRAVVRDVAGSISGTVTLEGSGDPVDGATVRAILTEANTIEELETDEVTALTDANGEYTLPFLAPGIYDVNVDDFSAETQSVTVAEGADVTGIDFSGTF